MQAHSKRTPEREKVKPGIWRRKNAKRSWTYEITFRDSFGKQRRRKVDGGLREAEAELAKVKARMACGERVSPNTRLLFKDAAEAWLTAKSPAFAEKTIASYRYGLDVHLLPMFGRMRLDKIDVTMLSKFVARMATVEYRREVEVRLGGKSVATEGYAVETIKSVLIPMSRTFAYAKRHLDFGGENIVQTLDRDERPGYRKRKAKKQKLGRDEIDQLIETAQSPWREIIATAVGLGTRIGETLGLCWSDIDFETGTVTIARQANSKRQLAQVKTATGERRIEAPDWLLVTLKEQKLRSPFSSDGDLVFPTSTGRPHSHGNVLSRGLYPALERAGLRRVSFHSLRHTHASLWIKDGGDAITLSKRLGHSTPQVTMTTYADEIEEANDHAARKARVDALFGNTKMAALMAARGGEVGQETATGDPAEVVSLSSRRNGPPETAVADG